MKTKLLAMVGAVVIMIGGCAKQPESRNALNELPQWYQEPTSLGDKYAASGSARPNKSGDIELQRIEAAAVARAELARRMELRVKDMYKRATQELGNAEEQKIDHAVQYATKQVADVTLKNSQQKKLYIDKDTGTLYTLIVLDSAVADAQLKAALRSSFNDEGALWQKFQATQMWKELDSGASK